MERIKFTNTKKISLERLNRNLIVLIVILGISYIVLQIFVTSIVGTKSEEIDRVRQEKSQYRLENEILTAKIDSSKSLEKTKDVAERLKLQNKNVNFLEEPKLDGIALNHE
jgi:hypothetical protein